MRRMLPRRWFFAAQPSAGYKSRYPAMQDVIVIEHPVIQTKLSELRDFTSDHR
jgi:hypothetical protein